MWLSHWLRAKVFTFSVRQLSLCHSASSLDGFSTNSAATGTPAMCSTMCGVYWLVSAVKSSGRSIALRSSCCVGSSCTLQQATRGQQIARRRYMRALGVPAVEKICILVVIGGDRNHRAFTVHWAVINCAIGETEVVGRGNNVGCTSHFELARHADVASLCRSNVSTPRRAHHRLLWYFPFLYKYDCTSVQQ